MEFYLSFFDRKIQLISNKERVKRAMSRSRNSINKYIQSRRFALTSVMRTETLERITDQTEKKMIQKQIHKRIQNFPRIKFSRGILLSICFIF